MGKKVHDNQVDEEYLRSLMAGSAAPAVVGQETIENEPPAPEQTLPSQRGRLAEYIRRFLSPYRCENRQGVYIDRELHSKISVIIGIVGKRNLTVGNYIDNVLTQHFEQHGEEVKSFCSKGYNKIL